jgi:hypothetical protein
VLPAEEIKILCDVSLESEVDLLTESRVAAEVAALVAPDVPLAAAD